MLFFPSAHIKTAFFTGTVNRYVGIPLAMKVGLEKITWSEAEIEYSSSNISFAEIDDQGWLTMKKKGVVTITATCGDVYLKKNITIRSCALASCPPSKTLIN